MPLRTSEEPLVGGFGCDELVLYGIRELAEQFLGSNLDIEVDHSASVDFLLQTGDIKETC